VVEVAIGAGDHAIKPGIPNDLKISIIIVNWNTREFLDRCLESIETSHRNDNVASSETVVVDNASVDGSLEMLEKRFPWVNTIENLENMGFAQANNQGIGASSGELILLLNSDTKLHHNSISTLVSFMDLHPLAGASGAQLLNADGSLQTSCHPMLTPGREFWRLMFLDKIWPIAMYPMTRWDMSNPRQVDVLKGACLMLRRSALEEIGVLDERYFMYTEEVDICYRLEQAGWESWYVPDAVVTHFGAASSSQMSEKMYLQLYRSKVQFYRKFGGERRASVFKNLLLLAYLPRLVVQPWNSTFRRLIEEIPAM